MLFKRAINHLPTSFQTENKASFVFLCSKYGNSAPNPKYFLKFSLQSIFIIALSARFQISINHLPVLCLTQNITNFMILRGSHSGHLLCFHIFGNNILLKHATDLKFSLQVVNMLTMKNYYGDFLNVLKFSKWRPFCSQNRPPQWP